MIRREQPEQLILITQHDHSRLSGELARQIGNALFAPPSPFESVVRAIAEHDCGWATFDAQPNCNAAGWPAHVFEAEIDAAIGAWTSSVEQLTPLDQYAALLVSMHTMALAHRAAAHHPDGPDDKSRQKAFRMRRFAHRQIEIQESLRRSLDMRIDLPLRGGLADQGAAPEEDLLRTNFFLLQFLDQISLNLCFDRLVFEEIDPVYPKPGEAPLSIQITRQIDGAMRLNPWPFNCQQLELDIPARTIAIETYRDDESLKKTCNAAQPGSVHILLRT